MTRAADLLAEARRELVQANKAINKAVQINSEPTRWAEVADGHRRRASAWRTLAQLTDDPMVRQALALAAGHDASYAHLATSEARRAATVR